MHSCTYPCTINCNTSISCTHDRANSSTYCAAHHTGTHQPTCAFATDTTHSAAHTYTHTATNAASHGA